MVQDTKTKTVQDKLNALIAHFGKRDAAQYIGIGYRTISRYAKGERDPKGQEAAAIDSAFTRFQSGKTPSKPASSKAAGSDKKHGGVVSDPPVLPSRFVGEKASKQERAKVKLAAKKAVGDVRSVEQSAEEGVQTLFEHQTLKEVLSTVSGRGIFLATVGRTAQAGALLSALSRVTPLSGDMPALEAVVRLGDVVGNTGRIKVDPDVHAFYIRDHLGLRFGYKHTEDGTVITVVPRFLNGLPVVAATRVVVLDGTVVPDDALADRLITEFGAVIEQEYARYLGLLSSLRRIAPLTLILDSLRDTLVRALMDGICTQTGRDTLERLITRTRFALERQK